MNASSDVSRLGWRLIRILIASYPSEASNTCFLFCFRNTYSFTPGKWLSSCSRPDRSVLGEFPARIVRIKLIGDPYPHLRAAYYTTRPCHLSCGTLYRTGWVEDIDEAPEAEPPPRNSPNENVPIECYRLFIHHRYVARVIITAAASRCAEQGARCGEQFSRRVWVDRRKTRRLRNKYRSSEVGSMNWLFTDFCLFT